MDSLSDNSIAADAFACYCSDGWANGICGTDIAECRVHLGGICDLDINECASTPCMNGAVCKDSTIQGVRDGRRVESYRLTELSDSQHVDRALSQMKISESVNSTISVPRGAFSEAIDLGNCSNGPMCGGVKSHRNTAGRGTGSLRAELHLVPGAVQSGRQRRGSTSGGRSCKTG